MNHTEPIILLLETATETCSVALSSGNSKIISKTIINSPNSHSKILSPLIEQTLIEAKISYSQLSAIAVSKGPGSYTGLRIGVSTAKGFAYALNKPLISIDTLKILHYGVKQKYPNFCTVAMIDAKRMEVYSAIFSERGEIIKPISADIIEKDIYNQWLKDKDFVFVGNGAEKTMGYFKDMPNSYYDKDIILSAELMIDMAFEKYSTKDFEDTAYFEPYYLKEFIALPSKVKGLL